MNDTWVLILFVICTLKENDKGLICLPHSNEQDVAGIQQDLSTIKLNSFMIPMNRSFDQLQSTDPGVKYGFVKELLQTGMENPELLYDHYAVFVDLLKSKNQVLRWTGIDLLGYLSKVDTENKTARHIKQLCKFLHGGHLITCNHAILRELLLVEQDEFETAECKNIAIGKVLKTFMDFIPGLPEPDAVTAFTLRATSNSRNATKKKALQLLKKIEVAGMGTNT